MALRGLGIDVDADFFHFDKLGMNWDHYGPREIEDREFTLVAISGPWRERWEGRNDPHEGAGAVAEANKLHGIFNADQAAFQKKVIIVELPSAIGTDAVPDELGGVQRVRVEKISMEGLEDLIRLLTDQPKDPLPELGEIPILPPASGPGTTPPEPPGTSPPGEAEAAAEIDEQIGVLRATAARMPEPQPWEGPHLPWYRAWHQVQNELARLERQRREIRGAVAPSQSLPEPRRQRELLELAPRTPGSPDHWMVYEGVLLLRVVLVAVPGNRRHPDGAALAGCLDRGTSAVAAHAGGHWVPDVPTLLLDEITGDWATREPRIWTAGRSTEQVETMQTRQTAAAALDTSCPVLAMDRTWNTAVEQAQAIGGRYFAAHDPEIAVETASALVLGGSILGEFEGVEAIDVAVQLAAGTGDANGLAGAESYAPSPFGEPRPNVTPTPPLAPTHFSGVERFSVGELTDDPEGATRLLLGPWLEIFRSRDVFDSFRRDPG